jgi:hypothetical protein
MRLNKLCPPLASLPRKCQQLHERKSARTG